MAADDRYRLAPLRDSRSRDERVKRSDLATAASDARETDGNLAQVAARVDAARAAVAKAVAIAARSAAERVRVDRYVARCRHALELAQREHDHAQRLHDERLGVVDAARSTLARARADREVIERHFARWRDQQRKLAERRED